MSKRKFNAKENGLNLREIDPLTDTQEDFFRAFYDDHFLVGMGTAGTGKSFLSMYLAYDAIINAHSTYNKLIICRSSVPSRDMGFLPGTEKEKMEVYRRPYIDITKELFGRGDAWEILEKKGTVEFVSTSFLRGSTLNNAIIFVDEIQNMAFNELHNVVTRVGKNSMLILTGDFFQMDLDSMESGVTDFYKIAKRVKKFKIINFTENDIVRNSFIKDYILAKNALDRERHNKENGNDAPKVNGVHVKQPVQLSTPLFN